MGEDIRYVIRCSGGDDSVAMIQLAHEHRLTGRVVVSYSNTGWATEAWQARMGQIADWVRSLGFEFAEVGSVGFEQNVLDQTEKGMFPTRMRKHCTKYLKILPTLRWLAEVDPDCKAMILVGVRRAESADRKHAPAFMPEQDNGRHVWHPLVEFSDEARDAMVLKTPIPLLGHRSDECGICINANRGDLRRAPDEFFERVEALEEKVGRPMFNPDKFMGATGIQEVRKWANSERGKYQPPVDDGLGETCEDGWCGR